jgi:hypothetical protein
MLFVEASNNLRTERVGLKVKNVLTSVLIFPSENPRGLRGRGHGKKHGSVHTRVE